MLNGIGPGRDTTIEDQVAIPFIEYRGNKNDYASDSTIPVRRLED